MVIKVGRRVCQIKERKDPCVEPGCLDASRWHTRRVFTIQCDIQCKLVLVVPRPHLILLLSASPASHCATPLAWATGSFLPLDLCTCGLFQQKALPLTLCVWLSPLLGLNQNVAAFEGLWCCYLFCNLVSIVSLCCLCPPTPSFSPSFSFSSQYVIQIVPPSCQCIDCFLP